MRSVGQLIVRTLLARGDDGAVGQVRGEVHELCAAFPPYPTLAGT
jgi:glycine/serine hydroxymethyltransferase